MGGGLGSLTGVQRAVWSVCARGQQEVIPKCDRLDSSGSGIECVCVSQVLIRPD